MPYAGVILGTPVLFDLFMQTIHYDTFKTLNQAGVAGTDILQVFNSTFLRVLLKSNVRQHAEATCKILLNRILFCISIPLIWAPSLGRQNGISASESLCICH